jgi:hypothetical protein
MCTLANTFTRRGGPLSLSTIIPPKKSTKKQVEEEEREKTARPD